ncbi:putative DNA recombination protein RmuC [Candidatus Sulfobium mesophilum]|uniref:Putative DNA recombination protein RmuC n=1 Tax=Candidatus Sulfobium mesophilum TaxID=2016548 RepID=A0A2U3QJD2_9BACT|nr:putative DNA recombination protein RmuC [Candidatus Sulfobium mesophilum]
MTTVLYVILGAVIGGVIVWIIASSRLKWFYSKQIAEEQMRSSDQKNELEARAKSAEAVNTELRQQVGQKDETLDRLRDELNAERQTRVEALTKLEAAQKSFEEQRALIEAMKKEMTDTFNALSSAALKSSSEDFLRLASEALGKVVSDTKGKLGEHQAAMDGMIKPLSETLKRYEEQIRAMEENRHKAYGSLEEQLRTLASTHENLQRETSNLVSALRKPQVRGRWGEMQLRRVAELSGMSMHCDFTEQISVDTDKGRIRPDMIVHLPMEREIVVDSKVSLEAYLDAIAAQTEEEKKAKMEKHAQQVRAHMIKLAAKDYWSQFEKSPEFVVLFIPGEAFLSPAVEIDNRLIEDGIEKRIIIATPTTFIALLRAIAYGWRQEQITKNAQQISMLGKELYERISTVAKYFGDLGSAIERSITTYNKVIGSLESRVLPSIRKFRELGATGAEDIPALEQIDQKPRNLSLLDPE